MARPPNAPDKAFFRLKGDVVEIASQDEFLEHLKKSNHLKNALYRPDTLIWAPQSSEAPRRYKIDGVTFENVSFSKTEIKNFAFQKCVFRDCLFIGCIWDDLEFHACEFKHCNMYKITIDNTYINPNAFDKCLDHRKHTNIGVHLFQQLLRNFSEAEQPLFLNESKFLFLRWRRWNLNFKIREYTADGNQTQTVWQMRWESAAALAYEKFFGSGIRLRNFIATSLILYALVAIINYASWQCAGFSDHIGPTSGRSVVKAIYFTATVLSTTGLGDIVPTTAAGRLLTASEEMFGLMWFAILASMIFKKIVR